MSRTISRIAGVLISLVFVFALFPGFKIKAAEIVDQGDCSADGSNVTWTLDSDGTLTISGTGGMKDRAFYVNQNIKKVVIKDGVTSIGADAFSNCKSLTSIKIPNSVTVIGNSTFENCKSLTSITIPNSVTSIGNYAFLGCIRLTSITIPDSVTSIGLQTFAYCESLTSITIPNSVTSIGNKAFQDCTSLTSITIPNSVKSIGSAFFGCTSLTSITIPNSVTSIGDGAFAYCESLTSITIPNSVTSIGHSAFAYCTSLTSITIPNSVTKIGNGAFEACTNLTSIIIDREVYEKTSSAFNGISPDVLDIYYNATYEKTAGGSISGNAKVHGSDEITIKPDQHYSVDKVVLTVKDKNGNDVEKELSPDNGKYLMPDYDFNNWTGDCKVTVSFKPDKYRVEFLDAYGTVLQADDLEYGAVPSYNGKTPEKEPTQQYKYSFVGWECGADYFVEDEELPQVTGPVTYIPLFFTNNISYTVTFTDADGGVIQSGYWEYGSVPVYTGKTPEKEESRTSTFTFDGWTNGSEIYGLNEKLPEVTRDATYSPVYKENIKPVYTVGEVKGDGINSDIVIDVHRNVDDENCLTYFSKATIDGTEMTIGDQYTATKGSTIITIKKDFLSTLSSGEHEVQVVFNDGSVSTKVTVAAKPSVPATGESTGTSTYIGLALVVAACVCGTGVILLKKRKEA